MLDLANISSLRDFQTNAKMYLKRLKDTGEPELLTVDGHAELVVQNAAAYEKLLDQVDLADSSQILRKRLAAADAWGKSIPADQVLAAIKRRLGLGAVR